MAHACLFIAQEEYRTSLLLLDLKIFMHRLKLKQMLNR